MTAEPPKVPTNHCPENRKFLRDAEHLIDAACRYGYVQYLDGQVLPGVLDLTKARECLSKVDEQHNIVGEHITDGKDICESQGVIVSTSTADESVSFKGDIAYLAAATDCVEFTESAHNAKENKENEGLLDAAVETKLLRPNSLELHTPVNATSSSIGGLEDVGSQTTISENVTQNKEEEEKPDKEVECCESKCSSSHPTASFQMAVDREHESRVEEAPESTRASLPSLSMCKATIEIPTADKELSLLVELVSSKHMSGAKVSSSSILGPQPTMPPAAAAPPIVAAAAKLHSPDHHSSPVSDSFGIDTLAETSSKLNTNLSKSSHVSSQSVSPGHSISLVDNMEPTDILESNETFWNDSLPVELTTKTSTPDSVDLPPPPSPPPPFSQTPDSPSLVSLPPLPPPPLDDDEVKAGCCSAEPAAAPPIDRVVDKDFSISSLPNGNLRHLPPSLQPISMAVPQADTISIVSDSSLVTNSSGSIARSEGTAASASDQPLVRDTRCDLLAAIREGKI